VAPDDASVLDVELLHRLRGEKAAFEQFYRLHVARVTRFLAGRCATAEDLADATSATFLCVMLSGPTYNPRAGSVANWLLSIAANEARRVQRKNTRQDALAKRIRASTLLNADHTERLAEIIDAEHEATGLHLLISKAPAGEQQLLAQIVDYDLSTAEAARAIGISPSAGRVRLSRLRGRLVQAGPGRPGQGTEQPSRRVEGSR
jgi:RNA polymerase sigma factor (sigma-70 family)